MLHISEIIVCYKYLLFESESIFFMTRSGCGWAACIVGSWSVIELLSLFLVADYGLSRVQPMWGSLPS